MTSYDVLIVGAGPAGMAAAIAACKSGVTVAVIDDNPLHGGQIWRGGAPHEWETAFANCGVHRIFGVRVISGDPARKVITTEEGEIGYSKLILATGARELFLPFPGWTKPHVVGVGGLQALAKAGLVVKGKRVIVAGSGPLLLAVAAYLSENGAHVPLIAEQASWPQLIGFGGSLLRHPSKIKQALTLKRSILRTRYLADCWVTRANGTSCLEEVILQKGEKEIKERCDFLAVAYGFVPNNELAALLGCRLHDNFVSVNEVQQTSDPNIFCAGEPTGLGGVDQASIEGEIAGCASTGANVRRSMNKEAHFAKALQRTFTPRSQLRSAVTPETIICRCEDVSFNRLQDAGNWREAKMHFRCGMGRCQGRICGPIVNYLFGWKPESVRPPVFPCTLRALMKEETNHE